MKRYDILADDNWWITETSDGDYVSYDDHLDAVEGLKQRVKELENEIEGIYEDAAGASI